MIALPEIDPAFTTKPILLALLRDGKPLDEKEGPYRIVIPAEKRMAPIGAAGHDSEDCRRTVRGQSFWIITSVDFMTAVTVSPFLSFNSSALRRVMALSMRLSPTRTTTWAMTSPN